jgi:Protein of unknown function (DUF1064)
MFNRRGLKYGNHRVTVDGINFHSKKEARHWLLLKHRAAAGEIRMLRLQPRFDLTVNGIHVTTYVGDFSYMQGDTYVVVDVKGFKTPEYELKKRLMLAVHKIAIHEV